MEDKITCAVKSFPNAIVMNGLLVDDWFRERIGVFNHEKREDEA
jgi:hypothetical protein